MSELKRCPWCNSLPELKIRVSKVHGYYIKLGCFNNDCYLRPFTETVGDLGIAKGAARKAWDTRIS